MSKLQTERNDNSSAFSSRALHRACLPLLVGLQIPVHDAIAVQIFDGQDRLREIESRHVRWQGTDILQ